MKTDGLLISDGAVFKVTNGTDTSVVIDHIRTVTNYDSVTGLTRRLNSRIMGFTQIRDSVIIASYYKTNCLILIDRYFNLTSTFSGICDAACGHQDGVAEAKYCRPEYLLKDTTSSAIFVVDRGNNAIRQLNIITRHVQTLVKGNGLNAPSALAYDFKKENLLISNLDFITNYNLLDGSLTVIADKNLSGFSNVDLPTFELGYLRDILPISDTALLVAENGNNGLMIFDLKSKAATKLCLNYNKTAVEATSCLTTYFYSMARKDNFIYVGQLDSIGKIQGKVCKTSIEVCSLIIACSSLSCC